MEPASTPPPSPPFRQAPNGRPSSSLHIRRQTPNESQSKEQFQQFQRLHSRQSQKALLGYEQSWENYILNQIANQLQSSSLQPQIPNCIQYQGDRLPRQIRTKLDRPNPKIKRKQLQKYRAYAVKMKLPSFQEITKIRVRENFQNTASVNHLRMLEELVHPKLSTANQNAIKEKFYRERYNSNQHTVQRKGIKSNNKDRNLAIRKRSIKEGTDQRHQPHHVSVVRKVQSTFANNRTQNTNNSPKELKKFKFIGQKQGNSPFVPSKAKGKEQQSVNQMKSDRVSPIPKDTGSSDTAHMERSVKVEIRRESGALSPDQKDVSDAEYLQKGISFKKRAIRCKSRQKGLDSVQVKEIQMQNESVFPQSQSRLNQRKSISRVAREAGGDVCEYSPNSPFIKETPKKGIKKREIGSRQMRSRQKAGLQLEKKPSREVKSTSPQKPMRNAKILVFNSEDKYIRHILLQNNWVINPDTRSGYYSLKWVFKPIPQDYNNLHPRQYINHIKNSHELTSKNYLNKNLKYYLPSWPDLQSHYPKCYDLSKNEEKLQFASQYTRQYMFLLLRKLYFYIATQKPYQTQDYTNIYRNLLQKDGSYDVDSKYISQMRKKQFKSMDMQNYRFYEEKFTLHINLVIIALKYWREERKKAELEEDQHYHFLGFNYKEFEANSQSLETYSQQGTMTFLPTNQSQYFIKEYFSTPSNLTLERIVKEYVYFQNKYRSEWKAYGDNNIWIIKPCSASRGNGIYLQNNSNEILFNSKGIQSKIVQKYIERPLLFRSPLLKNKKFDIRQWVLLRCVNPLEIYMFSHCYIRICSQEYTLDNLNNLKSHLTNYSFNKQHFKNAAQSVLDYDTLKQLLQKQLNIDYEACIKPKIQDIVINSIKSAQVYLQDYGKRCFSLLGYDIILDEGCNPWLLEINMSPACEERTPWLKEYLRSMGQGMLKIMLPQQFWQSHQEGSANNKHIGYGQPKINKRHKEVSKDTIEVNKIRTEVSQQLQSIIKYDEPLAFFFNNPQGSGAKPQESNNRQFQTKNRELSDQILADNQEIELNYQNFMKQYGNEQEYSFQNDEEEEWERMYTADFEELTEKYYTNSQIEDNNTADKTRNKTEQVEFARQPQKTCKDYRQNGQISYESQPNEPNIKPLHVQYNNAQQQNKVKVINGTLKWQLICYEQYPFPIKKEPEQLQVQGSKITSQAIIDNDVRIDQFQESKDHVYGSLLKIQRAMKAYLAKAQARSIKQTRDIQNQKLLKINFNRIGRNYSEKDSKAVIPDEDPDCASIWHYNYIHTYRHDRIEKRYVQKDRGSMKQLQKSFRSSHGALNTRARQKSSSKIKSFVCNQIISDMQEIILERVRDKPIIIKSNLQRNGKQQEQSLSFQHQQAESQQLITRSYF